MKYILTLSILISATLQTLSQVVVNVQAKPQSAGTSVVTDAPSFSFTSPFKLVVDVSGVPTLVGVEPIYLWGFIEGCCGSPKNGGDFCNSTADGLMTKESTNVWSYTFTSVKSYMNVGFKQAKDAAVGQNRAPDKTQFGFLVKADNGCGGFQSANIEVPFTGPVYIKEEFEVFPLNSGQNDVVTLVYNQELEDDATMEAQTEVYLYATADLVGGGSLEPVAQAEVGNTASLKLAKSGTQYTISMIPTDFFEVPTGKQIERVNVSLRSKTDANINFGSARQVRIVRIK
jgi:hypothetical protein